MITLNVTDKEGNITKTVTGNPVDIKFGQIRDIMQLLDAENVDNTADLIKAIYKAWGQLVVVLSDAFPEMDPEDWDDVSMKELVPALMNIISTSFAEIMKVPKDPN